jgi:outer membrane protein assembly factor BamA
MRPAIRALLASALLCLSLPSFTQAISTKIYFTGAAPYSDADLTSVVGLQSGQLFNDNEVQAGSQRLVDTGLFDSVAMTGTGKGPTRQVRFTIKPTPDDKLLPASFANFVWFTPAELDHALRAHVPLYHGLLPDSGNFADSVQAALVAMLKDKSINATVSHTVVEPTTQHPVRVVNFSIDDPVILLTQFKFEGIKGITKEQEMDMYRVMSAAANRPYVEGLAYNTVDDRILAGPRDLGFITAKIDDLQSTVQPSPHG